MLRDFSPTCPERSLNGRVHGSEDCLDERKSTINDIYLIWAHCSNLKLKVKKLLKHYNVTSSTQQEYEAKNKQKTYFVTISTLVFIFYPVMHIYMLSLVDHHLKVHNISLFMFVVVRHVKQW